MSQFQVFEQTNLDSTGTFTLKLTDRLAVRIYRDCRPRCLETGALQKGLVLLLDGKELIEEGVGFGVPVVKYEDKTFFSGKADVIIKKIGSDYTLIKNYVLDTVSLKKFGSSSYIDDSLYSPIRKTFQNLYLKHKKLNPIFNKVMELRDLAKIKTEFVAVKPRGTVTVTYQFRPGTINVQADFSKITMKRCCEILVLNEQGSSIFQKYVDSSGLNLVGTQIGAWEVVTAQIASLQSRSGRISFSLQDEKGAAFFRGWERTPKRFSWAGLSYSMRPTNNSFNYSIGISFNSR